MNRRSTPKADAQRAIVQALHFALPRDATLWAIEQRGLKPTTKIVF